jgi:hypothetical protein
MLDPRIYRAAFVPVVLALIVAAFSLSDRPAPITTTLPADAFDGARAHDGPRTGLEALARSYPVRDPGGIGDAGLAKLVAGELRANGFRTSTRSFKADTTNGERSLETVVGVRAGSSSSRLVVLTHRDAQRGPARAELSGTAALLELARVFSGRRLNRTLVLVSTSGGSAGAAGAEEFVRHAGRVDAALVLGDLSGRRLRKPIVVPWSDSGGAAPLQLQRTVDEALRTEAGSGAGAARAPGQFARLAFPFSFGEQGVLAEAGLPAVLLQGSGERGPDPPNEATDPVRLEAYGRSALRVLTALDTGPAVSGEPDAFLVTRKRVLPGWAVRLVVGMLLLPVLVAVVDGLARARRRREPVRLGIEWTLAGALPFLLAAGFVLAVAALGGLSAGPAAASPASVPVGGAAGRILLGALAVLALGFAGLRPLALRLAHASGDPAGPGISVGFAIVLCAVAVVIWLANPFAAAVLLPAVHLWCVWAVSGARTRRPVGVAALAGGLLLPVLVLLYDMSTLDLTPASAWWVWLQLVGGGHLGVGAIVAWCLLLGCITSFGLLVLTRRPATRTEPEVTVRGPSTYAGPGSLGGTESALRR